MVSPLQSSVSPTPVTPPEPAPAPAPTPAPESGQPPQRGLTLTVTPNESNAGPGEDRSNNAVTVTLTTPNREFSTEIRRDEALAQLEQAAARRNARRFLDNDPRQGPGPIVREALRDAESVDEVRETAVAAVELQASANLARTALDQSRLTNPDDDDNRIGGNDAPSTDFVDIARDGLQAQARQARFEAAIGRVEDIGSQVDLLA